ncbi:hypothetical protein BN946_scf184911.g107 [Trametes cinnabarina]|uniref:Helicase C-terminal domain-containing protein n=1 Tax=Pycnoporus cinnabarinus TaxID=5643 RepID=A0A060SAV7_PYCCI|nr:hypothetical protein BN946_scf184911.g107 [Trametes cinnabarina]
MKALIIDEAHHAAAPSYRRILSHFHPDIKNPDGDFEPPKLKHRVPVLGFSATFSRHDGLALGSVFERIVYHRDFLEMIKEQWYVIPKPKRTQTATEWIDFLCPDRLCNVRFTTVRANIDLSEVTVNARTGEFNPTSLAHVVNTDTVNDLVVRTWLDKAAHVAKLTAAFRAAGVDARYLHANTPAAERKALVEAFRAGRFPVLINCAVLTEGADIPNIDCVMVARPTRSRNIFAQMIGRGMRLSPETGKQDCRIIDFVDSQERVAGVISSPTLFGLDPSEVADDETLETIEERLAAMDADEMLDKLSKSDTTSPIPAPKSVTYIDHDDPFVLADQASGDPNIRQLSRNAWVCCGDGIYILECLGHGHIRVEPAQDENNAEVKFQAHYTPPTMPKSTAYILKISPFRKSKKILSAGTLAEAIRGCDTYAQTKVLSGSVALGLLRGAKWRWEPATDSQKQFIMKRWKARKVPTAADGQSKALVATEDGLQNLKKGEAANIITRLKHGAQSRHEKRRKEQERAALVVEKEAKRRAREEVKVGLLSTAH